MLQEGFLPQMQHLAGLCAPRQTLFFTATWPTHVQDAAALFLADPIHARSMHSAQRVFTPKQRQSWNAPHASPNPTLRARTR